MQHYLEKKRQSIKSAILSKAKQLHEAAERKKIIREAERQRELKNEQLKQKALEEKEASNADRPFKRAVMPLLLDRDLQLGKLKVSPKILTSSEEEALSKLMQERLPIAQILQGSDSGRNSVSLGRGLTRTGKREQLIRSHQSKQAEEQDFSCLLLEKKTLEPSCLCLHQEKTT